MSGIWRVSLFLRDFESSSVFSFRVVAYFLVTSRVVVCFLVISRVVGCCGFFSSDIQSVSLFSGKA